MKKTLLTLFVLLLGCTLITWSEDLGALAKKEKARRKAIEKEGKQSRTLTNADIPNIKSVLALEVTGEPEEPEGEETDSEFTQETPEASATTEEPEPETVPSTDPEVTAEADEQIQSLEGEKAGLEDDITRARETMDTGGAMVRNYGTQMQKSREAEDRIGEIDKEIQKLQEEESEEEGQEE